MGWASRGGSQEIRLVAQWTVAWKRSIRLFLPFPRDRFSAGRLRAEPEFHAVSSALIEFFSEIVVPTDPAR
jgi:hypothetical protein